MRKSSGTDFHIDVERNLPDVKGGKPGDGGTEIIGRFSFGRRNMRDVFLIRSEYNRLSNGNYDAAGIAVDMGAWAVATLSVLMVSAPESFNLDTVDPLMDDTWEEKTAAVFTALRAKELSFRPNSGKAVQEAGPKPGAQLPAGVPPTV